MNRLVSFKEFINEDLSNLAVESMNEESSTLEKMPDKNLLHRIYKYASTLNNVRTIDDEDEYSVVDGIKQACEILLKRHKNLK